MLVILTTMLAGLVPVLRLAEAAGLAPDGVARAATAGASGPRPDRVPDAYRAAAELVGQLLGEAVHANLGQAVEAGVEVGRGAGLVGLTQFWA